MKSITVILLSLFSVSLTAQKLVSITDADLQVVTRNGIVVKKNDGYFTMYFNLNLSAKDTSKLVEISFQKMTPNDVEQAFNSDVMAHASDIKQYNFKKIKNLRFSNTTDSITYQLYALNSDALVGRTNDLRRRTTNVDNVFLYCVLEFKNHLKILCFDKGYIIPLKGAPKLFYSNRDEIDEYAIEDNVKLKPLEISTGYFTNLTEYYRVDTVANKKVVLNTVFGRNVLAKSFDSIETNREFIAAYNKHKITLYNYQFKKLKLSNLRSVKLPKYFAYAQILSKNNVRKINLAGEDYENGDGNSFMNLSFQFPDDDIKFVINKKQDGYYIAGNVHKLVSGENPIQLGNVTRLFHTTLIDSLEFLNPGEKLDFSNGHNVITLWTESGYIKKRPILIYSKLKNGKYNLNTFDFLLTENPDPEIKAINDALPKDLDAIENINDGLYFIEKNGLYGYFPIVKQIKYKFLGKFEENFARFELPNGKKGWLDLNGTEFPDE